jgi:hypothetical protein
MTAALAGPRLALAAAWLAGNAIDTAFQSVIFPVVGLIFLPLTALAYALAAGPSGSVGGMAIVWPVLGFIADIAMLGLGIYWGVEYRLE